MKEQNIQQIISNLQNDILESMKKKGICGVAISIFDRNNILWQECFGYTDHTKKRKINSETIFSIQSIGKVFTATAFQRATQLGLISLDDKLVDIYPDFTIKSKFENTNIEEITFRHLLAHYAGFTHRAPIGGEWDLNTPTFEEYIQSCTNTWLRYPIGERYFYSNIGMSLAAFGIQMVSGRSFPDFVNEELCKQIDMNPMIYGKKSSMDIENKAIGYYNGFEAQYSNIIFYGAGGQFSSIKDMTKFVQFMLNEGTKNNNELISKERLNEMAEMQFGNTDENNYYGLGLMIDKETFDGIEVRSHTGGGFGYNAVISWIFEHNIGVVMLTNYYPHQEAKRITTKALSLFLEAKGVKTNTAEKMTPQTFITEAKVEFNVELFRKLEGIYSITGGSFELKLIEEKPFVIYNGQKFNLFMHSKNQFTSVIPIGIKIKTTKNGTPSSASVLMTSGVVMKFEYLGKMKKIVPSISKSIWNDFCGYYFASYLGEDFYVGVKIDNGYLSVKFGGEIFRLDEYLENIFFTKDGRAVEFNEKTIIFDNAKLERCSSPMERIKEIFEKEPTSRNVTERKLKELEKTFTYMNDESELVLLESIIAKLNGD